jgi:hypothetical protein
LNQDGNSGMKDKIISKIILWGVGMACAGLFLGMKSYPSGSTTRERLELVGWFAGIGVVLGLLFSLRLRNSK